MRHRKSPRCLPFPLPRSDHSLSAPRRQKMNGRFFAGRRIEASLYAGKQRFRRSGAGDEFDGEGDEDEKQRLDDFAQWLMSEGD